jgi:hypothetical protein
LAELPKILSSWWIVGKRENGMQLESTWLLQRGVIRKSLGYHWVILLRLVLRGNQGETKVGKVDRAKAIDGTKQIDQRLFSISET